MSHLDHRMAAPEELNETRNNTTFDHAFNWRILFLRKELTEFCGSVELTFGIV